MSLMHKNVAKAIQPAVAAKEAQSMTNESSVAVQGQPNISLVRNGNTHSQVADEARAGQQVYALNWFERLARKLVLGKLSAISIGTLYVHEVYGEHKIFQYGQTPGFSDIEAHLHVRSPATYTQVLMNGTIGSGEAYMEGDWHSPDLVQVIRLMVANQDLLQNLDSRWGFLQKAALRILHRLNANSINGSRKNISAHYDLGNDFFGLFLDPTMLYSSAVFPSEGASLAEASEFKMARICRKLQLKPTDHLLEIGTGWGGMAVYAAKHYGCQVTTTTISREQYEHAKAWVEREGLQNRVTLLLKDYRELKGQFDKIVSIEMIEAVGHEYYATFFGRCSALLKEDGIMVMQAITIQDQRFDAYKNSVDFIQRYIFPGGCLPSNQVVAKHIAEDTDMQIVGLDDITFDYAKTLASWRTAFFEHIDEIRAQGFDQRFINMWDFYLCYCEGGFLERVISTAQFTFAKPRCRKLPPLH
ncbi:SAM-dependent methyltransferase [Microbulbifer agarilyticus]|uniref:SAM-dependent methyltransferase n=1 Tax=Microbulbifer agarilyticus TaxID=260552 RepID=UPI001CD6D909|nr:cyclopropane-fatty-acyl-phospholipid synthase family protein [Microbulbifer agarilyticus]MCA0900941.1 cyclopropane-fatty-acyl-phospholipid synthase family protein [Microbulbifer agarilyticus]